MIESSLHEEILFRWEQPVLFLSDSRTPFERQTDMRQESLLLSAGRQAGLSFIFVAVSRK